MPPDVGLVRSILGQICYDSNTSYEPAEKAIFRRAVGDLNALADRSPLPWSNNEAVSRSESSTGAGTISQRARTTLTLLLTLACARVKEIPWHLVRASTLRTYTDASVLLAVHFLLSDIPGEDWKESVRTLDMAIVVAGAVGDGRLEWVHALIGALQPSSSSRPPRAPSSPVVGDKRPRSSTSPEPVHRKNNPNGTECSPLFAPSAIPSRLPPSLASYATDSKLYASPFVVRRYLTGNEGHPRWPALDNWTRAEYLLQATGRGRVVPVEKGRAYDDLEWGQSIVPWDEFLRQAGWDLPHEPVNGSAGEKATGPRNGEDGEDPLYLAQTALFRQFPALERDIATPDYVYSSPPCPEGVDYAPPDDTLVNVWIGPSGRGIISPAHTDPYYNCYTQVVGRKRVWIEPPGVGPWMYAYASEGESQHNGESDGPADTQDGPSTLAAEYMTNTSRVPLLRPHFHESKAQFPAFWEHAYPRAMEAVLEPGDMLVLPPRWWHAMRGEGEGPCWSISFWY